MNKALVFWIAVLLLFVGSTSAWMGTKGLRDRMASSGESSTTSVDDDGAGAKSGAVDVADGLAPSDFVMTDQLGNEFSSATLRGKVWLGSIFFSRCPSICVEQNQKIAILDRQFRDRGLEVVSMTCDPKTDTPARLREYSRRFNADPGNWHFVTGEMDEITRVGQGLFQVVVATETHSDRVTVFGRDGTVLGSHRATQPDGFAKLVELLQEALADHAASTDAAAADDSATTSDSEAVDSSSSETTSSGESTPATPEDS